MSTDEWRQHDGTSNCPVDPETVVTCKFDGGSLTSKAKFCNWSKISLYRIALSQ